MLNSLPILYSFVRCPYAMRARMALFEAKINCIIREVDLKNKPSDMLEISPKGTVPVLLLEDGTVIEESLKIIYHASDKHDSLTLQKVSEKQKEDIESLINANDTEFVKLLKPYKYPKKYLDNSSELCKQQIQEKFLDKYEAMLEGSIFLLGTKSIADIAILPFIRQFSIIDPEWFFNSKYKNIIMWLKMFTDNSDFQNIVMAKHKPWDKSSKPMYLLPYNYNVNG